MGVDSIEHRTWMTPEGFDIDRGLVREISDRQIMVCLTINHRARAATGRLPWVNPLRKPHCPTVCALPGYRELFAPLA
jgi:hypothetical protein